MTRSTIKKVSCNDQENALYNHGRNHLHLNFCLFYFSIIDYSIIENQPVGKARIDPSSGKLDWDYAFSGQRKKEIERYLKQIENQERQQEAQF